ncbi:MAG: methyltransferase domain-containing protein [Actinomycetota bacterium]|nr:methyltransferase domain-containing protein [Actinomycetota bacterium]
MVRHTLVARQLSAHLPQPSTRIADIGGGAGHQAIPLAREGYEVTLLNPSRAMLRVARGILESEEEGPRRRVRLVEGAGERAREILGGFPFDAVLCHGVLPYLEDPYPLTQSLASVARPGAVISVLAKNTNALAVRPSLEGRYEDALAALDADRDLVAWAR